MKNNEIFKLKLSFPLLDLRWGDDFYDIDRLCDFILEYEISLLKNIYLNIATELLDQNQNQFTVTLSKIKDNFHFGLSFYLRKSPTSTANLDSIRYKAQLKDLQFCGGFKNHIDIPLCKYYKMESNLSFTTNTSCFPFYQKICFEFETNLLALLNIKESDKFVFYRLKPEIFKFTSIDYREPQFFFEFNDSTVLPANNNLNTAASTASIVSKLKYYPIIREKLNNMKIEFNSSESIVEVTSPVNYTETIENSQNYHYYLDESIHHMYYPSRNVSEWMGLRVNLFLLFYFGLRILYYVLKPVIKFITELLRIFINNIF
uniref:Uncharacterized protein n=1 Tax=Avrainvillea sp. HV04061 TaxID=2364086 RepID=A0A3B8CLC0_9CHLO|nr:hypothetical protein [Avrainvillea sp. HV04061]